MEMQQGAKAKAGDNRSRLIIILVVVAVLAIVVVFSLPIIQVPVEVTETYYDTEYQQEPYTTTETYTVQTPGGSSGGGSQTLYYNYLIDLVPSVIFDRWATDVKFKVDLAGKPNPVVRGEWEIADYTHSAYVTVVDPRFIMVYQYRGAEASPQQDSFSFVPEASGTYVMRFATTSKRLAKYARLTLTFEWGGGAAQTTEQVKTREVTKYREVPVEVAKTRTSTSYKKGSVWQALFGAKD
jgi:hypothetical protein